MSYPSGNHFGGLGVGNEGKSWWITRLFIRILWRVRGSNVPVKFGGEK